MMPTKRHFGTSLRKLARNSARSQEWSITPKDTNTRPQSFLQTVVQSDGSSFIIRTSSPRPLTTLTKDTRNHPLWNPEKAVGLEEGSAELAKFASRYGDLNMETPSTGELGFSFEPIRVPKKEKAPVVEAPAKKKKGK